MEHTAIEVPEDAMSYEQLTELYHDAILERDLLRGAVRSLREAFFVKGTKKALLSAFLEIKENIPWNS